jgi:GNAT superfamily N-acetyltransferase
MKVACYERCEASLNADAWFSSEFRRQSGDAFSLVGATAEHEPFLCEVFAGNLALATQALGGDPSLIAAGPLLAMQFRARQSSYAAAHPLAHDYIVTRRADQTPVARLLVDWSLRDAPIVWGIDVAVHPQRRSAAVGLALLRAWVKTCDWLGRPAQLHVLPHNPARRIYTRLGFVATDPTAFPLPMRREPRTSARSAAHVFANVTDALDRPLEPR